MFERNVDLVQYSLSCAKIYSKLKIMIQGNENRSGKITIVINYIPPIIPSEKL